LVFPKIYAKWHNETKAGRQNFRLQLKKPDVMGFVRITSGTLKGRKVQTPEGEETRPLLTRLRKSLADILRTRLPGARVLDLFGGSGAIAFELLSNGAASAHVIELSVKTAALISENAGALGIKGMVTAARGDGVEELRRLTARGERFDIIIVAPPYGLSLQQKSMDAMKEGKPLAPGGVVVVQREEREPQAGPSGGMRLVRTRSYGRTVFDFYEAAR